MLEFGFGDEEAKVGFVSCCENEHVPELRMCSPKNVGNNESLTIDDLVKRDRALHRCRNAGFGRLQNLGLMNLLLLSWARRTHVTVFPLQRLRRE